MASKTPEEFLTSHGFDAAVVWRVWSAGESDLGCETILFTTEEGVPKTAIIRGDELVIRPGWDWFNSTYA